MRIHLTLAKMILDFIISANHKCSAYHCVELYAAAFDILVKSKFFATGTLDSDKSMLNKRLKVRCSTKLHRLEFADGIGSCLHTNPEI